MTPTLASAVRFGRITVLPTQRRVLLDGRSTPLGARAFDLLQTLLARRGEIVSKKDLLDAVWPSVVVEENNLQVQICTLRKLLGRNAIVTVPGRGYSFDASIELADAQGPAAGSVRRVAHGAGLSPLRGRGTECEALAGLLRNHRIVTVAGPAGVGKSRLVCDVIGDAYSRTARAELASMSGAATVASCVARALDLGFSRPPSAREVADALADTPALLVLENAEHVVEQAGELVEALDEAPRVRVICTSQVPLKARGEQVLRIAPLSLPAADDTAAGLRSPALELLLDAVSALQPRTSLRGDEARDAIAICRHLDGMPLAIELAGQRVPLLGMAGVRRLLADRFRLLASSWRGTAARHRTLLASMDWGWSLLAPRERAALCAVAAFQGRFTLGMARQALQGVTDNEWDAMEMLGALVDKSMVLAESGSRSAFRLLESTRIYAQARASQVAISRPAAG
jgi:predicted ATPase/DNA-binding winged helix-turn-helix (wHTH) protein